MYTIGHVAELLGISASTLRAWERRYGIVAAQRTESGYRLYDEAAIETLRLVQQRIEEGHSAREAIQSIRQAPALQSVVAGATEPQLHADTEELLSAAMGMDALRIRQLMRRRFAEDALPELADGWLLPAMRALGDAWESGQISVAAEHLVAHAVMRHLGELYEALPNDPLGPRVMIGLPAHGRHEVGLLSFACVARANGLRTIYVGADLPASEWGRMAQRARPDAVVLAASMRKDVAPLREVVAVLSQEAPRCLVAVGGAEQDQAPQSCLRLGHRMGPAVTALTAALTSPT